VEQQLHHLIAQLFGKQVRGTAGREEKEEEEEIMRTGRGESNDKKSIHPVDS